MSFRDAIEHDNGAVFLNCGEFADRRTILYDGEEYRDIPVVLTAVREKDRRQLQSDHVQGLYLVSCTLHCAKADLGGVIPEKGQRLRINDTEGGGGFFREFYVASSGEDLGMLRVELEATDE